VFFPLRARDRLRRLFRGVPTILVIAVLGFGAPTLQFSWVPTDVVSGDHRPRPRLHGLRLEVYRAGIESVHPSQEAAARSLGLNRWWALRFVAAAGGAA
jgi:polar amino acid transport system permease protein